MTKDYKNQKQTTTNGLQTFYKNNILQAQIWWICQTRQEPFEQWRFCSCFDTHAENFVILWVDWIRPAVGPPQISLLRSGAAAYRNQANYCD